MYFLNGDEQISLTGITARFGAVLPSTLNEGSKAAYVVESDPKSSCARSTATLAGAVAVVARGECTFLEKADAAGAAGASALVIVNSEDGRFVSCAVPAYTISWQK